MSIEEKQFFTFKEAADFLNRPYATLRTWRTHKKYGFHLLGIRKGRNLIFSRDELIDFNTTTPEEG